MKPTRPSCPLDCHSMRSASQHGLAAGCMLRKLLCGTAGRAVVACQHSSTAAGCTLLQHSNALPAAVHAASSWHTYERKRQLQQAALCPVAVAATTAAAPLTAQPLPVPTAFLQPSHYTLQSCLQGVFLQATAQGATPEQCQAAARHLGVNATQGDVWVLVECGDWVPAAAGGLQGPARAVLQVVPAIPTAGTNASSSSGGSRTRRPRLFKCRRSSLTSRPACRQETASAAHLAWKQ
ncbi:hypothetical protein COO60DRAFT_1016834 [Scenedesmus sp. NREL 46B-D3]|nr:hypothetical protein COO60DRAFT_1016834 [Scenedesmus sp. NREL 46B-D3]